MDVFELRDSLIGDYSAYSTSFLKIRDTRVSQHVNTALDEGKLWPDPQLGLNPAFEPGGTLTELVDEGVLHPTAADVFRFGKSGEDPVGSPMTLHRHQVDAIRAANAGKNYVLTTGTGSGKSLGYMVPIVDHVLRNQSGGGVKAIVVYPMNALANSQMEELEKFLGHGPWGSTRPVTFRRYTGQESYEDRSELLKNPPDILLTNYVMLELILTRVRDQDLVKQLGDLRFLVLDELHTYRGRQGADVALLVRRLREASGSKGLLCVGTSATLSTEGTHADQLVRVSGVASTLFGDRVEPESIIGETLRRSTIEQDLEDPVFVKELKARIEAASPPSTDPGDFCADPLSIWVESTFGIRERDGRLVRVVPRSLLGPLGGAFELASVTGLETADCATAIKAQLMAGYQVTQPGGYLPVFAFRLHQFISRGDTVYATLEQPSDRYINLNPQRFKPGDRHRVLLPLGFCRSCGQDYYIAARESQSDREAVLPRDLGDQRGTPQQETGFLYLPEEADLDSAWPEDPAAAEAKLPEDWFEVTAAGNRRVRQSRRKAIPRQVVIHPNGTIEESEEVGAGASRAWWTPTPFSFCLSCGVSHDARGGDFGRLSTLGSEGRSTATTVLSLSTIRQLRSVDGLAADAKKLLSFTDNRQDASLQAGHFNDFVQVTMLRSALWQAVDAAGSEGLQYDRVAHAVFEALNLPFEDYAADPDLMFGARNNTNEVFREIIAYRLYLDLRRGWRVNQPNLEQCGLLKVEYDSLDELVDHQPTWDECHPVLADADPDLRRHIATVLLDYLRRELAIKVTSLDQEEQERLKSRSGQRIAEGPWDLSQEKLEFARSVAPRSRASGDHREWVYVSSRGGFGRFLNRQNTLGLDGKLSQVDLGQIIKDLFEALRRAGLVEAVGADQQDEPIYQVPAAALRWVAGDGSDPYQDHIRMPNPPKDGLQPNAFFTDLYRMIGAGLAGVRAAEHIAQVRYDERIERENQFRSAALPILYCSPTMELGVDIAQLNVVSMRNVPPTPANYAQRSGRAGRSGQPALVFTYCSAGSSHDQYFFNQPEKMVAGQVEAPRLEVANEDLVRSHVQAIWLSESGLDLKTSMKEILDLADDEEHPELQPHVLEALDDLDSRSRAKARAETALADLMPAFRNSPWWTDNWLDGVLANIATEFRTSLERWLTLYRSALQQSVEQSRLSRSADRPRADKQKARALFAEANRQLDLLRAESDSRGQSDFYTYRYFAAEGFLPGYSFPRLPLSAFIPGRRGRRDDPEYLQRPRFLAISEFGPQSLIYHEGERYRINRVILPVGDLDEATGELPTHQAKWCKNCGYLHPIAKPPGPDNCQRCRSILPLPITNLFRLQNVATQRRDRITSDEEERQRQGYELLTGVHFATRAGKLSVQTAEVKDPEGDLLMTLDYGDTATIWRVNLGWRRRANPNIRGFVLDLEKGYWERADDDHTEDPDDAANSKRTARVIPYVEDNRNALLITPSEELPTDMMASLQAALKVALQTVCQLEENELAAEPLPSVTDRKVLLIYEASEGGAGVLRRLVDEPDLLARVATEALRRIHIDSASGAEFAPPGEDEPCEAACYDCLMSYRNQPDHRLLDRKLLRPMLERLSTATVSPKADSIDNKIAEQLPADAERFMAELEAKGYRAPDRQLVHFESAAATPDYVYDDACAVVYLDGTDAARRDIEKSEALRDLGYRVIRFGHPDDWPQTFDTFKTVFGEGNA